MTDSIATSNGFEVMTMRKIAYIFHQLALLLVILPGYCDLASAQDYDIEVPGLDPVTPAAPEGATLFENVRIFDGNGLDLSPPSNLLVRGNTIEAVAVEYPHILEQRRTFCCRRGDRVQARHLNVVVLCRC